MWLAPWALADEEPTRIDVARIAALARLTLAPGEAESLRPQLERILGFVAELDELDTADVEPTRHAANLAAPLREDVPQAGLTRDAALAGAPATVDGGFAVPKFVEAS